MTKEEKVLTLISKKIKNTKFEGHVFLAGGAVRDEILGVPIKDIDLLIDLPNGGIDFANWLAKQFCCFVKGSNPVTFPKFGTAKFNLRNTEFSDIDIECVMSRAETYTSGSRKPEVQFATLKDDVLRRDLTINTLLKNISTNEILDLTDRGIKDITSGIINTPLDPDQTFEDDPLRMLRAIRFSTKFNFLIEQRVLNSIKINAQCINTISNERIQAELNKIILSENVVSGFEFLRDTGLLIHIIPELVNLHNLRQNKFHAYDAWTHTMNTVQVSNNNLIARWSALLHDIGKFDTWSESDTGNGFGVHFFEHENVGAKIAENILKKLKFSNEFIASVTFIIETHMRFKQAKSFGEGITDKALRRIRQDAGDNLDNLLNVMHSDNISHGTEWDDDTIIPALQDRIEKLDNAPVKIKLPVNGFDIMSEFHIKSGIEVGNILKLVEDMWFENPNITKNEVLINLRQRT